MSEKFKDTIDWDFFWERENVSENMLRGGKNMVRRFSLFIDRYGLKSVADFGCGPGITLFILAERYPKLDFTGFDASSSVVKRNRVKASELGLSNLHFAVETLPVIQTRRKFDLVYSIATLHYVERIRVAIQSLFAHVNEGGFLVFNYPNRFSLLAYRGQIMPDDLENQRRFSLILSEKNLLTLKDIENTLGKRPRNFWKAMGEEPSRENNCVYLMKD